VDAAERLHRLANAAADLVLPGMLVGLGTGSTADAVVRELGRRVATGLDFTGVPTSQRTEALARDLGIPLTTLETVSQLDLGIDGADEIDPALDAIKGKGGALLHEKLVALACADFVLVASTEKDVSRLGEHTALPVEIVTFGWPQTSARLADVGLSPTLRSSPGHPDRPWITDSGGYLLDCATGPMDDPVRIATTVKAIPGVVEHGLFLGIAGVALQVDPEGTIIRRVRPGMTP
jgi:ribose 5-phosphate isomerase A